MGFGVIVKLGKASGRGNSDFSRRIKGILYHGVCEL